MVCNSVRVAQAAAPLRIEACPGAGEIILDIPIPAGCQCRAGAAKGVRAAVTSTFFFRVVFLFSTILASWVPIPGKVMYWVGCGGRANRLCRLGLGVQVKQSSTLGSVNLNPPSLALAPLPPASSVGADTSLLRQHAFACRS